MLVQFARRLQLPPRPARLAFQGRAVSSAATDSSQLAGAHQSPGNAMLYGAEQQGWRPPRRRTCSPTRTTSGWPSSSPSRLCSKGRPPQQCSESFTKLCTTVECTWATRSAPSPRRWRPSCSAPGIPSFSVSCHSPASTVLDRFDMCVIDLDQTATLLRQALNFTAHIAYKVVIYSAMLLYN